MNTDDTENMWKTLVRTFTDIVNDHGSYLEKILNMISADITYDDPGVFSKSLLTRQTEQQMCRECNFWLIYQLLRIASMEEYRSISSSYIRLQNDIIAACFIKQRWLAMEIMAEFLQLLNRMAAFRPGDCVTIHAFLDAVINTKVLGENYEIEKIEISSMECCRMVRTYCLHAITESILLFARDQNDESLKLMHDGIDSILRIFSCGGLMEKSLTVIFFGKYFKHSTQALSCKYSLRTIEQMMILLVVSLERLKKLNSTKLVRLHEFNDFISKISDLYITLNTLHRWSTVNRNWQHKLKIVVAELLYNTNMLLQSMNEHIDRTVLHKFNEQLIIFLQKLFPSYELATKLSISSYYSEAIMQLDGIIVSQITTALDYDIFTRVNPNGNSLTISVDTVSNVWALLIMELHKNRGILHRTLELANAVLFKLRVLQSAALNENVTTIDFQFQFFNSNLKCLEMRNAFSKTDENQMEVLDVCIAIIYLDDCKLLNAVQQRSLIEILFAPFLKRSATSDENPSSSWNTEMDNELCHRALLHLCRLRIEHFDVIVKSYIIEHLTSLLVFVATFDQCHRTKEVLQEEFQQLLLSSKLHLKSLYENVFVPLCHNTSHQDYSKLFMIKTLQLMCCTRSVRQDKFHIYQTNVHERSYICNDCMHLKPQMVLENSYYVKEATEQLVSQGQFIEFNSHVQLALQSIKETKCTPVRLALAHLLHAALKHTTICVRDTSDWLHLFGGHSEEICEVMSNHVHSILKILSEELIDDTEIYEKYIGLIIEELLSAAKLCYSKTITYAHQSAIIRMIVEFVDAVYRVVPTTSFKGLRETLLHCVRIMLFLLMQPESLVTYEASIAITEMCTRQAIKPWNMLCWYRHDIINLIIGIAVRNFISSKITLHQSLTVVGHIFECRDPLDFVSKHYKIILAILLPWCLRIPKCEDILRELAIILRKDLVAMLSISFLTIYTYLSIGESADVTNQCIDYIMKLTGNSFFHLLHSDIKRTVSEVLIFYHINAACVMRAIRSLLSKDSDVGLVSTSRIAEYIAERFLGVLANFEATLVNPDGDKVLKRHAVLSLGDIIRLLGGEHITPFRFKIVAVLRTVLTLSEDTILTKHCVNVWRIFVCTVDVRQLGSLLSTIFVTLEVLHTTYPEDVGYIFRYLLMDNNNLLGSHIGDLFFLEDTTVSDDIKKVVVSRIAMHNNNEDNFRFVHRFEEFIRHCNHENLKIRTYALSHLSRLFRSNRLELNEALLGRHQHITLETISALVETLIRGLCEQDINLQQHAAQCLGEVGALAPSHLPPNYAPVGLGFALCIHSDAFAIIALRELCRAYQRQKDSKFVDSFSLAIQEILHERGVAPASNKKQDIWETIPERLRPIMEPLLTSCYMTMQKSPVKVLHPVFSLINSSHEWSYQWASQMIESITRESTRNYLRSFKPSLRCDRGTLMMMLPYILLHSLQLSEGMEQKNRVVQELHTVFNAAMWQCEKITAGPVLNDISGKIDSVNSTVYVVQEQQDASCRELALQCSKYAFGLFDFLERWKRQRTKVNTAQGDNLISSRQDLDMVEEFLRNFDDELLAKVNFKCNEYARALQYLEQSSIDETRGQTLQNNLSFLCEIYSRLGDTDSVEGVMALKATDPTLPEQILYHNATGRLHEAVACYERLLQLTSVAKPPKLDDLNSMIECYLRLDQPETALLLAESLLVRFHGTALHDSLLDIQAEPLYRLGRFEELEELLLQRRKDIDGNAIMNEDRHWGVICGSLMIEYRQPDYRRFTAEVERARLHVIQSSCNGRSSSRSLDEPLGTYEKRYEHTLKLHIISEFEKCGCIMRNLRSIQNEKNNLESTASLINDIQLIVNNLNARLEVLQPNANTLEPIISLRRILLKEIRLTVDKTDWEVCGSKPCVTELRQLIDRIIGELWMKSTELASRAKMYQQALLYILHAESYRPRDLFIKNAKLLWDRRDVPGALKVLERGVNEILSDSATGATNATNMRTLPKDHRLIYAEGKRLIAVYNAEASNISATLNRTYFKEAVELNPESEIALVQLAQYVEKLCSSLPNSEQDTPNCWEMMYEVMKCYGKSMMYGSNYIYQSMPRVLSIWLDSTAKVLQLSIDCASNISIKIAQSMNKLANQFKDTLSPYFFFTAFSQLISRVAHPSAETYDVLKGIIVKLLLNYPQQTLWMMLSVYKSSYTNRVRRCVEIFNDRQLTQLSEVQKLIKHFNELAERLIELTNREIPASITSASRGSNTMRVTVSSLVKALPKLLAEKNISNVVIPIEQCMQIILNKNSGMKFQSYPTNAIYIVGIEEEVTVLHSLQKPRKITLRGHNGKLYTMMMKPKDDLRKDFRLMEFNAVVKQYLAQDADAKFRRLYIRTYAVLPLNEECGIIEWISNLNTFRGIVCAYYKQRGLGMTAKELRNYNYTRSEPLAKKRHAFESILLPRHPAVFSEWFRDCFPNPHNWFQARTAYIKTTAVISMVGYILGLGDRHGENILFDSTNGDTVHVDFNCLFNRGETFLVPELVPFRLTHNMIDAMGPLGVEGLYRRCCEIVLRILQTHAPTFMSVLKPFVYDPMVSWSKASSAEHRNRDNITERIDPQAMQNVSKIEKRLKGYVKISGKLSHIPLSIQGQVNHLIKEATDKDNLAQMYIGWSAYT